MSQEAQQVLENGPGTFEKFQGFLKRYYGYLDGFQELHKSVLMGSLGRHSGVQAFAEHSEVPVVLDEV